MRYVICVNVIKDPRVDGQLPEGQELVVIDSEDIAEFDKESDAFSFAEIVRFTKIFAKKHGGRRL